MLLTHFHISVEKLFTLEIKYRVLDAFWSEQNFFHFPAFLPERVVLGLLKFACGPAFPKELNCTILLWNPQLPMLYLGMNLTYPSELELLLFPNPS